METCHGLHCRNYDVTILRYVDVRAARLKISRSNPNCAFTRSSAIADKPCATNLAMLVCKVIEVRQDFLQGCHGYGDSHGYGYGMGMGIKIQSPRQP